MLTKLLSLTSFTVNRKKRDKRDPTTTEVPTRILKAKGLSVSYMGNITTASRSTMIVEM